MARTLTLAAIQFSPSDDVQDNITRVAAFVREAADPKDATKKYTTTWFDMFRIENGRIVEHWDREAMRRRFGARFKA